MLIASRKGGAFMVIASSRKEEGRLLAVAFVAISFFFTPSAAITDTLSFGSTLAGDETLVSNGSVFELGFFAPEAASAMYLGVWYHGDARAVVWVANRQSPLNSYGELRLSLSAAGELQILDGNSTVLWSSPAAGNVTGGGRVTVLDTGNVVIRCNGGRRICWESFHHPTDTLLPGMQLGDLGSGVTTSLSAWTSSTNPLPSNLKFQLIQGTGLTQFELVNGTEVIYATSPWNGETVTSGLFFKSSEFDFNVISGSISYSSQHSLLSRLVLDVSFSRIKMLIWINKKWVEFSYYPRDPCDSYGYCGAHGYCDLTMMCNCLGGFKPRSPRSWRLRDFSDGCVRQKPLACSANNTTDGFRLFNGKLPAKSAKTYTGFFSVNQCRVICLSNCSCRAYTTSSMGCTIWTGDLLDMRQYNSRPQHEVYVRVAHIDASPSPTAHPGNRRAPQVTDGSKSHKKTFIIAGCVFAVGITIVIIFVLFCCYGLVPWKRSSDIESFMKTHGSSQPRWPQKYTFAEVKQITRSFSEKLGSGGYGVVYRGQLPGSNVPVAVKLLTNKKGRGEDFENEVTTISRVSHFNIISLLGYCVEGSQRALIYEYMPKGSLDLYTFGTKELHWKKLYEIIVGVARGIDYLYTGCKTQIVHFDIKPQNILLDQNLCPKISDFGLAKRCKKKETQVTISCGRGTFGYIAPEVFSRNYGKPSGKSDVYSFGMLILDMLGARKKENIPTSGSETFPGYLIDNLDEFCKNVTYVSGEGNNDTELVKKMVTVALHCVQIRPAQRPSPSKALQMLESQYFKLELPSKVDFNFAREVPEYSSVKTLSSGIVVGSKEPPSKKHKVNEGTLGQKLLVITDVGSSKGGQQQRVTPSCSSAPAKMKGDATNKLSSDGKRTGGEDSAPKNINAQVQSAEGNEQGAKKTQISHVVPSDQNEKVSIHDDFDDSKEESESLSDRLRGINAFSEGVPGSNPKGDYENHQIWKMENGYASVEISLFNDKFSQKKLDHVEHIVSEMISNLPQNQQVDVVENVINSQESVLTDVGGEERKTMEVQLLNGHDQQSVEGDKDMVSIDDGTMVMEVEVEDVADKNLPDEGSLQADADKTYPEAGEHQDVKNERSSERLKEIHLTTKEKNEAMAKKRNLEEIGHMILDTKSAPLLQQIMDKSLEKGDQGLSKDSREGSIVTNEMDKTDKETEIKGTDNQFVVHGVDGPFLMDKSRWPNLVSSADEGSQDQEGMGELTQEEKITTLGDIQLSANREISPPNNRKSPGVEKNEDTGSTIRATGKEEEAKNIGQIEEEDFMDHLSDQSKISDMENDCQGWQSPKSKKKKRQIVVATTTSSRVPRDGIPIATKAINRAKDKNNTSEMECAAKRKRQRAGGQILEVILGWLRTFKPKTTNGH